LHTLYTLYGFYMQNMKIYAVLIYVALWKRVGAAFTCGAQRFSLFVNDYARNVLKFDRARTLKILRRKTHIQCQKLGSATSKDFCLRYTV